jgi:hypothetical protein
LLVLALIAVASLLTLPSPPRPGGPVLEGAHIDSSVVSTLRRSCMDCHSDATRYPWYSYIAPVSLLIRSDVGRGRERLNFSKWAEYPLARRMRALTGIANQVKDGEMPLSIYTLLHPGAKLTQADVAAIFQWAESERARLIAEAAPQ